MSSIDRPHGTTLAALKGIAITASLLTAGQLGTITLTLPSLYPAAQTSHKLAAQQFAHQYRTAKTTGPPVEIISGLIFSGLAYIGYRENSAKLGWKLWSAAAVSMISVIPWTIAFMERPSYKLLWVSEVASSASTQSSTGIKGTASQPNGRLQLAGGQLDVPSQGKRDGAITPMEEFEPFGDSPMDPVEYEQLKVIKLLKQYGSLNTIRTLGPLAAGVLGLWAVLLE